MNSRTRHKAKNINSVFHLLYCSFHKHRHSTTGVSNNLPFSSSGVGVGWGRGSARRGRRGGEGGGGGEEGGGGRGGVREGEEEKGGEGCGGEEHFGDSFENLGRSPAFTKIRYVQNHGL